MVLEVVLVAIQYQHLPRQLDESAALAADMVVVEAEQQTLTVPNSAEPVDPEP